MKFDVTLSQYERIYKIVASVGRELSHGEGKSCQFYNVTGALLLEKIYKVKARPVMGAAFIKLTESGNVLSFAKKKGRGLYSSVDAFHCWIETDKNFIDFTSPEYREALMQVGSDNMIQRKMLQKSKSSVSQSPYELHNIGDFYFEKNIDLTNQLLSSMLKIPVTQDLAEICLEWHKRSKKKLEGFNIFNDLGEVITIAPVDRSLTGSW